MRSVLIILLFTLLYSNAEAKLPLYFEPAFGHHYSGTNVQSDRENTSTEKLEREIDGFYGSLRMGFGRKRRGLAIGLEYAHHNLSLKPETTSAAEDMLINVPSSSVNEFGAFVAYNFKKQIHLMGTLLASTKKEYAYGNTEFTQKADYGYQIGIGLLIGGTLSANINFRNVIYDSNVKQDAGEAPETDSNSYEESSYILSISLPIFLKR